MASTVQAFAPAKVNLSLRVHGKRTDGYHELTSLVAFADVGDRLSLAPSPTFSLSVNGPTACRIDSPNLIETAAERLKKLSPDLECGTVTLHKNLPVGAGVGGGSSDVAAFLRAVRGANFPHAAAPDWAALALSLGADVPVCLNGTLTWMRGVGEQLIAPASPIAPLPAVLINPGVPVATGPVFSALNAPALPADFDCSDLPDLTSGLPALAALRNDLEAPAMQLVPEIKRVRDALEASPGVHLVRMSGSGATYFGLYGSRNEARLAAAQIAAEHENWWVQATMLGDAPPDSALPAEEEPA